MQYDFNIQDLIYTNVVVFHFERTKLSIYLFKVVQVITSSSWSAMGPATSWPPHWPQLLMLRMETPSPSLLLSLCKLHFIKCFRLLCLTSLMLCFKHTFAAFTFFFLHLSNLTLVFFYLHMKSPNKKNITTYTMTKTLTPGRYNAICITAFRKVAYIF